MSSLLLLGVGTDASAGGGGANNIVANGTPVTGLSATNSLVLPAFTTTVSNCVVILAVAANGVAGPDAGYPSSVTGGGLTWNHIATSAASGNLVSMLWASAASTLASVQFTINFTAGPNYVEAFCFAFSGMNATAPVDGATSSTSSPISLTTSNANDVLIASGRNGGYAGVPTGFTNTTAGSFAFAAYKIVTATQSALSIADPAAASDNGMVATGMKST